MDATVRGPTHRRAQGNQDYDNRDSLRFEKINVRRVQFDGPVAVVCLVVNAETALASPDVAVSILQEWVRFERYCQMLWIGTPSAASIQGVGMNNSSSSGSAWNISALPFGNSTPALTKETR